MTKENKKFNVNLKESIEVKFGKDKPTVLINCIVPVADNIGSLLLTPLGEEREWGIMEMENQTDIDAENGVFLTFYNTKSIDLLIDALNDIKKKRR